MNGSGLPQLRLAFENKLKLINQSINLPDTTRTARQNGHSLPKDTPHSIRSAHGGGMNGGMNHRQDGGGGVEAMSPAEALKKYVSKLSDYEQSEIFNIDKIYFVGPNANKIKAIPHSPNNDGYDDDNGDYKVVAHDHLAYRYEILGDLGSGSFGKVIKVKDYKTGRILALKIIRNRKKYHHQAIVEVQLLKHLNDTDPEDRSCIIRMQENFYFRHHLCITFEVLSMNLYEFTKKNNFRGCSLGLIRKFTIQILTALKHMHSLSIIHCDLKPENILMINPSKSRIRVIDFGSSCYETQCVYTYIQSRFYRSPEVILGLSYDRSIDMWSVGCILAEMYTGYPLFPGEDEREQIQCFCEILPLPPRHIIEKGTRAHKYFHENGRLRITPNKRGIVRRPGTKDLHSVTKCNNVQFIDFLSQCFHWDPKKRMSAVEALSHPWITGSIPNIPSARGHRPPSQQPSNPQAALISNKIAKRRHHRLHQRVSDIGQQKLGSSNRYKRSLHGTYRKPSAALNASMNNKSSILPPLNGHSMKKSYKQHSNYSNFPALSNGTNNYSSFKRNNNTLTHNYYKGRKRYSHNPQHLPNSVFKV